MSDIPNGRYKARAIDAILGETMKGKAQLEITWEVIEGEHEGAQVTSQHFFTGGAKPITLAMMRHIGWSDGADLDTLRGTATISLYEHTYEGETSQKVRVYTPNAGGYRTPENKRKSPSAAKAFLDRLGGNGGDAFDTPDPATPPPMPGDDAAPGKDDLPF